MGRMTGLQLILLGVFGGSLGTTGLFLYLSSREDPTAMILENQSKTIEDLAKIQSTIAQGKIDIQKNLTDTDLLEVSCSSTYMEKNGSLLCREMFCRLQTREGSASSQTECETISNVANTFFIIENCTKYDIETKKCFEYIEKRK